MPPQGIGRGLLSQPPVTIVESLAIETPVVQPSDPYNDRLDVCASIES